jgi:kynureninase
MVCLDFPGGPELCAELLEKGIVTDYRRDCGLRLSPHFYNDESDIRAFFAALK